MAEWVFDGEKLVAQDVDPDTGALRRRVTVEPNPEYQQRWYMRLLVRLLGVERVLRLGAGQAPGTRCPWKWIDEQCTLDAGHRGECRTEVTTTNLRTGRSFTRAIWWHGVNYGRRAA